MGIQRRKSTAHIITLQVENGRLRPPPTERAVFKLMMKAMPQGYFAQNQQMLRELCSHIVTAEELAAECATACAAHDMDKLDKLTRGHARESKAVANLSRKLQLLPKSRYGQQGKASPPKMRPWEPQR